MYKVLSVKGCLVYSLDLIMVLELNRNWENFTLAVYRVSDSLSVCLFSVYLVIVSVVKNTGHSPSVREKPLNCFVVLP